jgi:hypothetical protein
MGKSLLLGVPSCALNLVVIVVQPSDMSTGELCNFSSRSSNSAANVKNLVSIFDSDFGCEVVFVAGNCLVEAFTIRKTAKVE